MFNKLEFEENAKKTTRTSRLIKGLSAVTIGLLGSMLVLSVISAEKAAPELAQTALDSISLSGVENPVTAVLLNFRSYDTLLEIAVLLIVAVAMMPESSRNTSLTAANSRVPTHPVLIGLIRCVIPLSVILSAYLLWTGAYAPGGAFQAGAVLAGAGVALLLVKRWQLNYLRLSARAFMALGLAVFVIVAATVIPATGRALNYPADYAGALILIIEVAATLSIAFVLILLVDQLLNMANKQVKPQDTQTEGLDKS